MRVGFIGLGKMGSQMVTRLLKAGHTVVATDHNPHTIEIMAAQGAVAASTREQLTARLGRPAIVWLMIPPEAVEDELNALLPLLPKGGIVIDGGNSDFRRTQERAKTCAQSGITLIDVGTSGGILAQDKGFSMMVGGGEQAYATIEPLIQALAQPHGYGYFGPSGAGHYIKMVHNAIEYGVMEAYAEGYHLLKEGGNYPQLDLTAIARVWQHGSIIASTLNELSGEVLSVHPQFEGVKGAVATSGEAGWALEVAQAQHIELPVIQAALNNRIASQHGHATFATKLLAALRHAFGGHNLN